MQILSHAYPCKLKHHKKLVLLLAGGIRKLHPFLVSVLFPCWPLHWLFTAQDKTINKSCRSVCVCVCYKGPETLSLLGWVLMYFWRFAVAMQFPKSQFYPNHTIKECWALLINICPWFFLITTIVRGSPHPYLILVWVVFLISVQQSDKCAL